MFFHKLLFYKFHFNDLFELFSICTYFFGRSITPLPICVSLYPGLPYTDKSLIITSNQGCESNAFARVFCHTVASQNKWVLYKDK